MQITNTVQCAEGIRIAGGQNEYLTASSSVGRRNGNSTVIGIGDNLRLGKVTRGHANLMPGTGELFNKSCTHVAGTNNCYFMIFP
ncbi:hypothetical protein GALL_518240 [mine drainage metagenome]|uniref:Uncharacterized protein n=1 Tax=mine drainage metagenome TaxID=410659 RepID=A0A1J5PGC5_9ZZZZ